MPDSLIERVLKWNKEDVKKTRGILRKYFSVFMSNKLIKGKLDYKEILKKHLSSKDRDYEELYMRIISDEESIIDLGAGVNGLSSEGIGKKYLAIEATKVYVDLMNKFFSEREINGEAIQEDLFNLDKIAEIVKSQNKPAVWMFNIIDALELEPNYSKKLILKISEFAEKIVLSWTNRSLQKQKKFSAKRFWIINFISENFNILDEFEINGEHFIVFRKKF